MSEKMKVEVDTDMSGVADGLHAIAEAINELATEIRHASQRIGFNDAIGSRDPGALEFIGMRLRDGVRVVVDKGQESA
jgi:hypothetical protein